MNFNFSQFFYNSADSENNQYIVSFENNYTTSFGTLTDFEEKTDKPVYYCTINSQSPCFEKNNNYCCELRIMDKGTYSFYLISNETATADWQKIEMITTSKDNEWHRLLFSPIFNTFILAIVKENSTVVFQDGDISFSQIVQLPNLISNSPFFGLVKNQSFYVTKMSIITNKYKATNEDGIDYKTQFSFLINGEQLEVGQNGILEIDNNIRITSFSIRKPIGIDATCLIDFQYTLV